MYSKITDDEGNTLAYQVTPDLGSGVFLFDHETGESTPLSATDEENVYINEDTGQRYKMDFPAPPVTASPLVSEDVTDLGTGEVVDSMGDSGNVADDSSNPTDESAPLFEDTSALGPSYGDMPDPVPAVAASISDYEEAVEEAQRQQT